LLSIIIKISISKLLIVLENKNIKKTKKRNEKKTSFASNIRKT
jgi:hypothetical protein